MQEQETQKAIAAAEQIIAKAREAAAQDHARMLTELKREVGRLVVQTTATVTGKILTPTISSGWPRKRQPAIGRRPEPIAARMKITKQARRDAKAAVPQPAWSTACWTRAGCGRRCSR